MNLLTNTLHIYKRNLKMNIPIEQIEKVENEKIKKYAKKFLEKYNKLTGNEKRYIENRKCDSNISLLKYIKKNNFKQKMKFQRYIKNAAHIYKTYVKAYIPTGYKGMYKNYYYQEYEESSNTYKCLYCNKNLSFSEGRICDETELINQLKKIKKTENLIKQFQQEMKQIKIENKNIKKIIWCNEQDLFCDGECRRTYFLKKNSNSLRRLIFERDKGICNGCKLNCTNVLKQIQRMKYFSFEEKINYFIKKYPIFIENINQLKKIIDSPKEGYIWQVDHIFPVFRGGGQASFENLQTLCVFCHQKKTQSDLRLKKKDFLEETEKATEKETEKEIKSKYFQKK